MESNPAWPSLCQLMVRMHVQIPMPRMRVREVLALRPGLLLLSKWAEIHDVPLGAAGVQLSWCEFASVDDHIGVRLTRPA